MNYSKDQNRRIISFIGKKIPNEASLHTQLKK
jgi:hypothetical protein